MDMYYLCEIGLKPQGQFEEALKIFQQMVNDNPRDFRPYLCQVIFIHEENEYLLTHLSATLCILPLRGSCW